VLELANAVSLPLREAGLDVEELKARPGAGPGDVRLALHEDIRQELDWMADNVAAQWEAHLDTEGVPPTAAVLVRRRSDMAAIAVALRERGLPVEVVGLGGLLDEPEVRDLVSALRVLVDPLAGTAATRLLTGSRWRLAARDLAALWNRARDLAGVQSRQSVVDDPLLVLADALPGEHAEQAGLADALDDPGDPDAYSQDGYRRIRRLGGELAALRRRLTQPLSELVADVERTLLLDIEAMSRPGMVGRAHLDAFSDVVADFAAASPSATLPSLLDYLYAAEHAEDGLEPGEVEVSEDRVQILTVHSAKGLEWRIVALPHLVKDVFPGRKKSSCWLKAVTELPADLRGDAQDLPELRLSAGFNRKEVDEALTIHAEEFEDRRLVEERRLFYVGVTRAEHTLFMSGHWWAEAGDKPKGPSVFLQEMHEVLSRDNPPGDISAWAPEPEADTPNPLAEDVKTRQWPADPLGKRRDAVVEGAELVLAALDALRNAPPEPLPLIFDEPSEVVTEDYPPPDEPPDDDFPPEPEPLPDDVVPDDPEMPESDDPEGWAADVDVLLAERAASMNRREQVELPDHLSVSQLVELAKDPDLLARRLRRPLPFPPNPLARRGTAFHTWLENRFGATRLLDIDELPGAGDADAAPDADLDRLKEAFLQSAWADRTPYDVEVPFEAEFDGISVRGRMDAVYKDPDGWTVVDWKTGAVPEADALPALSVQLAAYRLAWAALVGEPLERVRAAFHYVRHDHTLRPADLLDEQGLKDLIRTVE
jgi:DNA helicase-2/ATP-dependent DNA helicase PcrA